MTDLSYSDLEVFLNLVDCGTISGTADRLYMSQPALTKRVNALEARLGYPLFIRQRGHRSVRLTEHGLLFLPVARRWMQLYREAGSIGDTSHRSVLHLASIGSIGSGILKPLISELLASDPGYSFSYHFCRSEEGYLLVEQGTYDIALVDHPRKPGNSDAESVALLPIGTCPFVVISSEALSDSETTPVSAEELQPAREVRLPWNISFDLWHAAVFPSTIPPMVRLDQPAMLSAFLIGPAFAIVPQIVAGNVLQEHPGLYVRSLKNGPPDETYFALVPADYQSHTITMHFLRALEEKLHALPDIHPQLNLSSPGILS